MTPASCPTSVKISTAVRTIVRETDSNSVIIEQWDGEMCKMQRIYIPASERNELAELIKLDVK